MLSTLTKFYIGDGNNKPIELAIVGESDSRDYYTKIESLSNSTRELLGIGPDAVLDDALVAIMLVTKNLVQVTVVVKVNGNPAVSGIEIIGISGLNEERIYTDSNGIAIGYASPGEINIETCDYIDLASKNYQIQEAVTGQIIRIELNLDSPTAPHYVSKTSTPNIRFSPYVDSVDVAVINGGDGGEMILKSWSNHNYGRGGNGSEFTNKFNIIPDTTINYPLVVGAAGLGGIVTIVDDPNSNEGLVQVTRARTYGQSSSFMGVTGGFISGGNAYPNLENGKDANVYAFNDSSLGIIYGGSGGGSCDIIGSITAAGGKPNGGAGGKVVNLPSGTSYIVGGSAYNYGGGGGGGTIDETISRYQIGSTYMISGNGSPGIVLFRWRLKNL